MVPMFRIGMNDPHAYIRDGWADGPHVYNRDG